MNDKGQKNRWLGLLFICFSLLIISLDNTILNVALPAISTSLGASQSELQWIVDAYILVFASLLLTMGSIGDRIGRKRILQFGVIWFGVFSLMAALANSVEMLIAARALLGLGGAIIMPATLSLVTANFPDPKERAQAIALWAAVFGVGSGIGPLLGGYLLEHFDWNAMFLVNLPVVAIALVGGHFFLAESKDEAAPSPDVPGVLLSIAGLFALVYGIVQAGVDGWTAGPVLISLGMAVLLLVVFFMWENRTRHPMLPLYLFRNPSFTGANVAITMMFFGMLGVFFAISQLFQSVQGYTPLETGYRLFLPTSLMLMVTAGTSAKVAQRLGTKRTVGLGFLIAASSMFLLSQTMSADMSYGTLLVGMLMMTGGIGVAMSPATNSIMGSVPAHKAGVGSAMNDTTREVGGALGVAVLGTVMNHTYLHQITSLKAQLPPEAYAAVSSSIQGAHAVAHQIGGPLASAITGIADQAFAAGMADAMFIAAIVMVGAALFTLRVLPSQIRCLEPDCEDDVEFVGIPAPAPAASD